MKQSKLKVTLVLVIVVLAVPNLLVSVGQEELPTPAKLSERQMKLEHELSRLRRMEGGMGANHPQLKITRERISEIQAELVALERGPGPFAKAMVAEKGEVDVLLRQMSDTEVRQAVLHLFGRVRDLERRVDQLQPGLDFN